MGNQLNEARMDELYKCGECGWIGKAEELESEKVESCMGDDSIEVCPKCGSMSVFSLR